MAYTFTLQQGNLSIPLIFNASTQTNYKMRYAGLAAAASEGRPRWHVPDDGPPRLVDLTEDNRTLFFTLDVRGGGDVVLNNLHRIARLIDGAAQEAARYHILGDADRVELKIQRQNSTRATIWPVVYGFIDDMAMHLTDASHINDVAHGVVVALTLGPYGESDTKWTAKNLIENGDMGMDGSTAGRAAGFGKLLTTESDGEYTISTTTWLINGQSQRLTFDAINEGIVSPLVNLSGNVGAFVYIHIDTGTWTIRFRNITDSVNIGTPVTVTTATAAASASYTLTSATGEVWYRFDFTGNLAVAKDTRIQVFSSAGGNVDAHVDGFYVQEGSTLPPFWTSFYQLSNRHDQTATNPEYVNALDFFGVPGDAPALVNYKMTAGASRRTVIVGKGIDGAEPIAKQRHWLETDSGNSYSPWESTTLDGTHTWVESGATGTTGDSYLQVTHTATSEGWFRYSTYNSVTGSDWAEVRRFLKSPRRVFSRVWTNDAATQVKVRINLADNTAAAANRINLFDSGYITVSNASQWDIIDFGFFNPADVLPSGVPDETTVSYEVEFYVNGVNTKITRFDYLWLPHAWGRDDFMVYRAAAAGATNLDFWFLGHEGKVIHEAGGIGGARLGTVWTVAPGPKTTRTTWILGDTSNVITDTMSFTIEVTPRTRRLLGTA